MNENKYIISILLLVLLFGEGSQKKEFNDILTDDNELNYFNKNAATKASFFKPVPNIISSRSRTLEERLAELKLVQQKLDKECNLISMKLNFFDRFENVRINATMKIYSQSKFCHKSIWTMFTLLDKNSNNKLTIKELSSISVYKEKCTIKFFNGCDTNQDGFLTIHELCDYFIGTQRSCIYYRNPVNIQAFKLYLTYLEHDLSVNNLARLVDMNKPNMVLDDKGYVPLCDHLGNFLSEQCDSYVRCWCVDYFGSPVKNTLSYLENVSPVRCSSNM